MPHPPLPSMKSSAASSRRACLLGLALALVARGARSQQAASSPTPRLRFRSRRAACDCSGDLDDEAIEAAEAARNGKAASAASAAAARQGDPAAINRPKPTTQRRTAP